jgi:hypothetical protein
MAGTKPGGGENGGERSSALPALGRRFPGKPLPKPVIVNQRVDQPPIMVSESKLSTAGFSSVSPSVVGPSISTGTLLVTATGIPKLDKVLADLQLILGPAMIGYAVHGSCPHPNKGFAALTSWAAIEAATKQLLEKVLPNLK